MVSTFQTILYFMCSCEYLILMIRLSLKIFYFFFSILLCSKWWPSPNAYLDSKSCPSAISSTWSKGHSSRCGWWDLPPSSTQIQTRWHFRMEQLWPEKCWKPWWSMRKSCNTSLVWVIGKNLGGWKPVERIKRYWKDWGVFLFIVCFFIIWSFLQWSIRITEL